MSDDILSKYAAAELLALQNAAVAFAKNDLKIAWYNQSFKKNLGAGRIKGISITNLFSISETKILSNIKSKNFDNGHARFRNISYKKIKNISSSLCIHFSFYG